ncbi:MAG: hypothetical protein ABNH49_12075 [Hyphomonas sp.]|jgi:hypothetical protein
MTDISGAGMGTAPLSGTSPVVNGAGKTAIEEIGVRFEQLLWSEMLSHTGLEEAFTQSGGEAASAFSRMIIEAIAEDLAEKHPLGLNATGIPASSEGNEQIGIVTDD